MEVLVHQLQNLLYNSIMKINIQMKYKLILFVFLMCLINSQSNAQLGIGTNSPNASAMLDVTATNKGLLLPRMTNTQKNAISNPATGLIVFCTDCGTAGLMNMYNGTDWVRLDGNISNTPSLTTTAISAITATTATSGGNVVSIGGSSVSAKGVCWSTSPNPTIANSKTTDGIGSGSFTSNIGSLTSNTTYYVRAYATNTSGTSYGNETSFTTSLAVGSVYGGGIIAYLLTSSDAGYNANVQHGLIVSSNNLSSTNATWGCGTSLINTSTALGTGAANTALIINSGSGCASTNAAAKLCDDYSVTVDGTTYSDWYLPSKDELQILYNNRAYYTNMGDDIITPVFASSSESSATQYYAQFFATNWRGQYNYPVKNTTTQSIGVRAVRSF